MKALLTLVLTASLMACATAPAPPPQDGVAGFGQRTFVDGPHVTPIALVEDSRCPVDARCVWAGRLVIAADIETGPNTTRRELTLREPVQIADGALELTGAMPLPKTGKAIELRDYRFTFTFAGGI